MIVRWTAALGLGFILAIRLCGASTTASAERVRACMIDEPPWGDAADPDRGIYADLFRRVAAATGLAIDYAPTPLARTLDEVASGACSFTITSWAAGRSDRVIRGESVAVLDYGVALRQGLTIGRYEDLIAVTLAMPRGLMIGEPFDNDARLHKVPVYGYEQAMGMVEGGHADGAVGSLLTLRRIVGRHGTGDRFGQEFVLARVTLAVQMNKDFAKTETARRINEAVASLRRDGTADQVIRAHFGMLTD